LRYTGPSHALFPALLLANSTTGFSLAPEFNAQHDNRQAIQAAQTTWQFPDVLLSSDAELGFDPNENLTAYALFSNGTGAAVTPHLTAHLIAGTGK
jgi:hypothetical protein